MTRTRSPSGRSLPPWPRAALPTRLSRTARSMRASPTLSASTAAPGGIPPPRMKTTGAMATGPRARTRCCGALRALPEQCSRTRQCAPCAIPSSPTWSRSRTAFTPMTAAASSPTGYMRA